MPQLRHLSTLRLNANPDANPDADPDADPDANLDAPYRAPLALVSNARCFKSKKLETAKT